MACIDRTYVTSYEEWKEVIGWAKKTEYICPNGLKYKVIDSCYYPDLTEEEVKNWLKKNNEIPVLNTSYSLDYFLIKHCPIKLVQDRMKDVYGEEYVRSVLEGRSNYDLFVYPETGKRIKFIEYPKYRKAGKIYSKYLGKHKKDIYWIEVDIPDNPYCGYNKDLDKWILDNELGDWTEAGYIGLSSVHSLKALIRKIRKWNLPIGTEIKFEVRNNWEKTKGKIIIKK